MEELLGLVSQLALTAASRGKPQDVRDEVAVRQEVEAVEDVVDRGDPGEHLGPLEHTTDAERRHPIRPGMPDGFAAEQHLTGVAVEEPCDQVDGGMLSRSVPP